MTAAIAKFVDDYEAAYGVLPSSYALGMYITGQLLVQVLEDSDTKLTGRGPRRRHQGR